MLEARHVHARELAASLAVLGHEAQGAAIVTWLDRASKIRAAVQRGRRDVTKRVRIAQRRGSKNEDDFGDVVIRTAMHATANACGRTNVDELTVAQQQNIRTALTDAARSVNDAGAAGHTPETLQVVAVYIAAASAFAHEIGEQLDGLVCAGLLGSGKSNAPLQIAALALAELRFNNREICDLLDLDQAQARRLTLDARVS